MDVTLEQAYEVALATIGRMTVEAHFYRAQIEAQTKELEQFRAKDMPET